MAGLDSYTKLLLHCDGVDEAQAFTDETGKTVTAYGNAKTDTGRIKFGTAAAYFDGWGDYLGLADHVDWNLGTGNFTIDLWCYPTDSSGTRGLISTWNSAANQGLTIFQHIGVTPTVDLRLSTTLLGTSGNQRLTLNQWNHVAVVRKGLGATDMNIAINGVFGNVPFSGNIVINSEYLGLVVGRGYVAGNALYFKGWMDEMRWSKGIARWTADFTPPTEEYSASSSSSSLSSSSSSRYSSSSSCRSSSSSSSSSCRSSSSSSSSSCRSSSSSSSSSSLSVPSSSSSSSRSSSSSSSSCRSSSSSSSSSVSLDGRRWIDRTENSDGWIDRTENIAGG